MIMKTKDGKPNESIGDKKSPTWLKGHIRYLVDKNKELREENLNQYSNAFAKFAGDIE